MPFWNPDEPVEDGIPDPHRRLRWLALLVVLLIAGGVLGGPEAWRWVRKQRVEELDQQALQAEQEGRLAEALQRTRSAQQLKPGNLERMRRLCRLLPEEERLFGLIRLNQMPGRSIDDLEALVKEAFDRGALQTARRALGELRSLAGEARARPYQLRQLLYQHDWHAAYAFASELVDGGDADLDTWDIYFNLTDMLADQQERAATLRQLEALSQKKDALAHLARMTLLRWAPERATDYSLAILEDAQAPVADRLQAASLALRADLLAQRALIEQLEAKLELDDDRVLEPYASWLLEQGLYDDACRILPAPRLLSHPPLASLYLECWVLCAEADKLRTYLESGHTEKLPIGEQEMRVPEYIRNLCRATAARRLGETERAQQELQWAWAILSGNEVERVEQMMRRGGHEPHFADFYRDLSLRDATQLSGELKHLRQTERDRAWREFDEVVKTVGHPARYLNRADDYAYVLYHKLVSDSHTAPYRHLLEKHLSDYPEVLEWRVLLALAYLLEDRPELSETLIASEIIRIEQLGLRRTHALPLILIYAAGGKLEEALDKLRHFEVESFSLAERRLLTRYLPLWEEMAAQAQQ